MEKVIIYVLVDPVSLKIRYIGRTRSSLTTRLGQHVSKARHNYDNTHKSNWIRSLLKINSRPYIRKIAEIDGWEESHILERSLINKYKDRLVNHDDRGEGGKQRTYTQKQKDIISKSVREYYQANQIQTVTPIHAYNYDGSFHKSYPSIKAASIDLNIYHGTISKHLLGYSKIPNRIKMQFNYVKVDSMKDYTI